MDEIKTFSQALPILQTFGLEPKPIGGKLWSIGAMTYDKGGVIALAREKQQQRQTTGLAVTDAVIVGVPMMDETEARATVTRIKTRIDIARGELLELHDREGWRALGYKHWEACARQEFGGSAAQMYRLLSAAQIERAIDSPIGEYPESHLREVAKLDTPDQQKQALDQARAKTDGKPTAKDVRQAAAEISAPDLPPEFAVIQRRYERHDYTLASNVQGDHRAYVTRKEGMTGVVTFSWPDVLDKLERLEAAPDPDPAAPAFRLTCPTCGATIMNGVWGDQKECGSCWRAHQQPSADPAHVAALEEQIEADRIPEAGMRIPTCVRCGSARTEHRLLTAYETDLVPEYPGRAVTLCSRCIPELLASRAALARLDQELPKSLSDAGYYWQSAQPPILANNDDWTCERPLSDMALAAAQDRERQKHTPSQLTPGAHAQALTLLISIRTALITDHVDQAETHARQLLKILVSGEAED